MAWLSNAELEILNNVFVDNQHMFLNRRGNLRQRFLGFYFTETKSLTLLCRNLDKVNHNIEITNQYKNTLRNIGLLSGTTDEISFYGKKLLKILYYNNNRLINLIRSDAETFNIETMDAKDAYQLELFIYLVVLHTGKSQVGYDGNPIDIIHNIENFFAQIKDSLNATKKSSYQAAIEDIKKYIDINNLDKLFLFQIMNYSGYEISRFLKLSSADKEIFWNTFSKAVTTCPNDIHGLGNLEEVYFNIIRPYTSNQIQRDIRHRVKYALSSHIIYNSIIYQQKKIKLKEVKNNEALYNILRFLEVKSIFEGYQLRDILNLVEQDRESIYYEEIVKYYLLDDPTKYNDMDFTIAESLKTMQDKGINKDDKIILIDRSRHCITDYSMKIKNIFNIGPTTHIQLERCNLIDRVIIENMIQEEE